METTSDQPHTSNTKYIELTPDDDFSQNPYRSIRIWTPFFRAIFAFIISYLAFLSFSTSSSDSGFDSLFDADLEPDYGSDFDFNFDFDPDPPQLFSAPPRQNTEEFNAETYLNQISHLSIQLDRKIIQASFTKEQTFPMLISRDIHLLEFPPKASVDIIFVFEFPKSRSFQEEWARKARALFEQFLTLMTDQDRISIVLIGGELTFGPIVSILPLTNATRENRDRILFHLGDNILKGRVSKRESPVDILDQRNGTNQATGVIIVSKEDIEFTEYLIKARLGLQAVETVLTLFHWNEDKLKHFQRGLTALQNGVAHTQLLIKPEESQLFKGIEILNQYGETVPSICMDTLWTPKIDGPFLRSDRCLDFGPREYIFDIKIPRITQDLPSSPVEVKIASCQLIFILFNGSQVVKNVDLTVKVVGEREEFVHEEESREVMKNFYSKWGKRFGIAIDVGYSESVLKRFKESLEGSIVKDDEVLQKIVRGYDEYLNEIKEWERLESIQEDLTEEQK